MSGPFTLEEDGFRGGHVTSPLAYGNTMSSRLTKHACKI